MATIRTMSNQILVGRVGQTTYYSRKGQQVARQSRNNSNYGEGASRTFGQMSRRVKWSNLVNLYKVFMPWMPKAFEGAAGGVTVYNRFMSLNVPISVVNLTKSQATTGASVLEPVFVSRGQLASIATSVVSGSYRSDIATTIATITATTTVGEFSADIVQQNPGFLDGDNIAMVLFSQDTDNLGAPHVASRYFELTLDSSSQVLLQSTSVVANGGLKSDGGVLSVDVLASLGSDAGAVFIHTRKVGGSLRVSTQKVVVALSSIYEDYATPQAQQEAIDSYGVDPNVPLDPGF